MFIQNFKNAHIQCCESFGHLSPLFRPISPLYLSQKCLPGWKTRDQLDGSDLVIKTHQANNIQFELLLLDVMNIILLVYIYVSLYWNDMYVALVIHLVYSAKLIGMLMMVMWCSCMMITFHSLSFQAFHLNAVALI